MDIRSESRVRMLVSYAEARRVPLVKISSVKKEGLKELKILMASMLGMD